MIEWPKSNNVGVFLKSNRASRLGARDSSLSKAVDEDDDLPLTLPRSSADRRIHVAPDDLADRIVTLLQIAGPLPPDAIVQKTGANLGATLDALGRLERFGFIRIETDGGSRRVLLERRE
jgi:hypothetical protein